MTNEELLAGFLDRSLSEDQLVELESLRAVDPAFDQDVRELVAVEDVLLAAAPVTVIPTDFLAHVEDTIAATVATDASATTAGVSSAMKTFGVAIAAVGTAVGIYVATQRTEPFAALPSQPVAVAPVTTTSPSSAPTVESVQAMPVSASRSTPIASRVDEQPSADGSANAYASASTSLVDRLLAQYASCKQQNDNMRCTQLALNIGSQYRKQGEYQMATTYFNEALASARSLRVVQYEVEALGNIGLLNLDRGNTTVAATYLRSAIERANGIDGANVDAYRRALSGLE